MTTPGSPGSPGSPGPAGQSGPDASPTGASGPYAWYPTSGQETTDATAGTGGTGGGRGLAIATLVLGILAAALFWTVIGGLLLGLVAVVLGIVAVVRARRGRAGGRGMAITGLVLGALGLIASGVVGATLLASDEFGSYTECVENAGGDRARQDQCTRDFQRDVGNG